MKNIQNLWLTYSLLGLSIFNLACAEPSEAEKEKRRDNAFDVAGTYVSKKESGSELELGLQIENKSDRSDVVVSIDRASGLTTQEIDRLKEYGVGESEWSRSIGSKIVLSADSWAKENGGSNVSDDFGKTSTVRVRSRTFKLNSEVEANYSLEGKFKKEDLSFSGELRLNLTRTTSSTGSGGKPSTTIAINSARMKVTASSGGVFWTQYFGTWKGKIETDANKLESLRSLNELNIQKISETEFRIVPQTSTFSFQGESFSFESTTVSVSELRDRENPSVEVRWSTASGKRIVLTGTIWSLGNLSANLILISGSEENIIASIQMVRK